MRGLPRLNRQLLTKRRAAAALIDVFSLCIPTCKPFTIVERKAGQTVGTRVAKGPSV